MSPWLIVHIGGQKWRVYLVSPKSKHLKLDGQELYGKCDYEKCSIFVDKSLSEEARQDVLWHEFMHALLHVTGAAEVYDHDYVKDETLVSKLTPTMHRLLKDLGFRFPKSTCTS